MKEKNQDLISKKALLQKFGISYGSLYRWKRKGLIPDEWFMRMSAPTGQETYFNRTAICERITTILDLRDNKKLSLEEMAKRLNPEDNNKNSLIVTGTYGTKEFDIADLTDVSVIDHNGKQIELLKIIKENYL